ncbi:MAG: hypothetical protein WC789_09480 [Lentisphaeria bacterium]
MAETHPKRLTLSIPPPLEDGGCDAGCPLYYVVTMETGVRWDGGQRVHIRGCAGQRNQMLGAEMRPGPRCPWGKKEGGR